MTKSFRVSSAGRKGFATDVKSRSWMGSLSIIKNNSECHSEKALSARLITFPFSLPLSSSQAPHGSSWLIKIEISCKFTDMNYRSLKKGSKKKEGFGRNVIVMSYAFNHFFPRNILRQSVNCLLFAFFLRSRNLFSVQKIWSNCIRDFLLMIYYFQFIMIHSRFKGI